MHGPKPRRKLAKLIVLVLAGACALGMVISYVNPGSAVLWTSCGLTGAFGQFPEQRAVNCWYFKDQWGRVRIAVFYSSPYFGSPMAPFKNIKNSLRLVGSGPETDFLKILLTYLGLGASSDSNAVFVDGKKLRVPSRFTVFYVSETTPFSKVPLSPDEESKMREVMDNRVWQWKSMVDFYASVILPKMEGAGAVPAKTRSGDGSR